MRYQLLCVLLASFSSFAFADGLHLRMENADESFKGKLADEVPGALVYDPAAKRTLINARSLKLIAGESVKVERPQWARGGSFTLEAFVKPTVATEAAFVKKARRELAGGEVGLMLDHFRAHNQFYFRTFIAAPGSLHTDKRHVGHYGSSAQYGGDKDQAWRHIALVYDADRKTTTSYIDYYLSRTEPQVEPLTFDDGPLLLGGGKLEGFVDEVRYSDRALRPAHFLRVVPTKLDDVSFESQQAIVPADAGGIDVKEHFGAIGDGVTDDTAAFQQAFDALCSRIPLAYHTLLVPPGTYLISQTIQGGRFIDVKGAGPTKTVLKLKDGVFTDLASPLPILRLSGTRQPPGLSQHVNGSSISIYLDGMMFDTGRNNPAARGLEFHANNVGRLENVVIRSGDGAGVCGLDLTHHDCGPALVRNVEVLGFDYGIQSRYQEYSMTFEHVRLKDQKRAGVFNQGNILAIRGLVSENSVPAIVCEGANTMVTLLDSSLIGGSPKAPAIQSEGALYCLRVKTNGYREAISGRTLVSQNPNEWVAVNVPGPNLDEHCSRDAVIGHGQPTGALKLPIAETPTPAGVPLSEWVNVMSFADRKTGDDWSPVVQAAIDSGARVIYVPANSHVSFEKPIVLRGRIERIIGFGGSWNWSQKVWKDPGKREQTDATSAPPPLVVFDDANPKRIVWIDRLGIQSLRHASPGTLVLRSSSPERYTTGAAGGRLFAEDIGGADWHFDHPQTVWVRQWNPESHAAGPCIHSRGATIWSLGFKTEYESQKLLAEAGAATEILGAFIYPLGKIPEDRPIFENRDSRLSLIYGTSVYQSNHKLHIRDSRGGETKLLGNDSLRWSGSRAKMELFTSDAR